MSLEGYPVLRLGLFKLVQPQWENGGQRLPAGEGRWGGAKNRLTDVWHPKEAAPWVRQNGVPIFDFPFWFLFFLFSSF